VKLKIVSIHEQGDASKEYVLLDVVEDCNLNHYGLADTTYTSDDKISNKLRHFYWFPGTAVEKGDRVVLRTGAGKNVKNTGNSGKTEHRFFWGLQTAVWNDDGDAAILFEIKTWKATRA
jgi:hypothetical protein